jgi:hypothetical protein
VSLLIASIAIRFVWYRLDANFPIWRRLRLYQGTKADVMRLRRFEDVRVFCGPPEKYLPKTLLGFLYFGAGDAQLYALVGAVRPYHGVTGLDFLVGLACIEIIGDSAVKLL